MLSADPKAGAILSIHNGPSYRGLEADLTSLLGLAQIRRLAIRCCRRYRRTQDSQMELASAREPSKTPASSWLDRVRATRDNPQIQVRYPPSATRKRDAAFYLRR